jgi:MoxR-like ATPase
MDANGVLSLDCQGKKLVALNGSTATPDLVLGHERVGLFDPGAVGSTQAMDLQAFLQNVQTLSTEMKSQMVAMDGVVDVLFLGLISGANVFLLSLPGSAKTTIGRMLGRSIIDGKCFWRVMNPDLSRNDIFGTYDLEAMKHGKWKRVRDGVAAEKCYIALFDEYYKSNGQVRAMTLEIFEECSFTEGVNVSKLDLLLAIAASNEIVDPSPRNADWDRLAIRYEVKYPTRLNDIKGLFTAGSGRIPIKTKLDPREILLAQAMVEAQAMNPPKKVIDTAAKILRELNEKDLGVSPRRQLAWMRVATAKALIERGPGAVVEPGDLTVGENILWITPESRQKVSEIVNGISDPDRQELLKSRADYETLRNKFKQVKDFQAQTLLLGQVNRLRKSIEDNKSPDFVDLSNLLSELREKVMELEIKKNE